MPSILDFVGAASIPPTCDGFSLLPLLQSPTASPPSWWRTEAHWEYDFRDVVDSEHRMERSLGLTMHQSNLCVLRGARYKLVQFGGR
jgi:hypothetical protein